MALRIVSTNVVPVSRSNEHDQETWRAFSEEIMLNDPDVSDQE
jgi:hypothetical protein